jgi:hypothetical protein
MKTHKAVEPIPKPALVGLKQLISKQSLPSDEEQKKATLEMVNLLIKQGGVYTKTFEELSFGEQSLSINGQIASLRQAIQAHVKTAEKEKRNPDETFAGCIQQLGGLISAVARLLTVRTSQPR